jgi:hypothetical protein
MYIRILGFHSSPVAPKGVLAKHYTPQGVRLLREIYDKAELEIFGR